MNRRAFMKTVRVLIVLACFWTATGTMILTPFIDEINDVPKYHCCTSDEVTVANMMYQALTWPVVLWRALRNA